VVGIRTIYTLSLFLAGLAVPFNREVVLTDLTEDSLVVGNCDSLWSHI